jgi:hypothetical protein
MRQRKPGQDPDMDSHEPKLIWLPSFGSALRLNAGSRSGPVTETKSESEAPLSTIRLCFFYHLVCF